MHRLLSCLRSDPFPVSFLFLPAISGNTLLRFLGLWLDVASTWPIEAPGRLREKVTSCGIFFFPLSILWAVSLVVAFSLLWYSKSPTYEPSSCKLSKMWTCSEEGQRETRGISNWRTKEIHDAGDGKEILFEDNFWGSGPEHRTVHRCSECDPEVPCHVWWEKKSYYLDLSGLCSQDLCRQYQAWMKQQPALRLLLLKILSSSISRFLSLLQSVALLACSLCASSCMPAVTLCESESVSHSVKSDSAWPRGLQPARFLCPCSSLGMNIGVSHHSLLWGSSWPRAWNCVSCIAGRFFSTWAMYFSRYCSVKLFIFCVCLLCIICMKSITKPIPAYSIANCVSWVPRLTFFDL